MRWMMRLPVGIVIVLIGSSGCEQLFPFGARSSDAPSSDAPFSDARSSGELRAPSSCAEILARDASAPSGSHTITVDGRIVPVYCDMSGGGWTRSARFDASVSGCPGQWMSVDVEGKRVCKNPTTGGAQGGSAPAFFSSPLKAYTQVKGFVRAFQFGSMDAFNTDSDSIDGPYVDGVSITCGSPRRHIWTLAAGLMPGPSSGSCPCINMARQPPAFVGKRYHCDTANTINKAVYYWLLADSLWSGGTDGDCKTLGDPAWFEATLDPSADQPIEVRLLQGQQDSDENIGVVELELWVK